MHNTAMEHARLFFDTYLKDASGLKIVEIGSQDVNGSLRTVAPKKCDYVGVDFQPGKGVDVILSDPYSLPLPDDFADVCVTSSCFEHSEFFWLSFLEVTRIVKPSGLIYLNVPSNGDFHRYPVDCWRFYPDSGVALQNWARRNGYGTTLLESFIGKQRTGVWNDFVAVFANDEAYSDQYPDRIQDVTRQFTNGFAKGRDGFANYSHVQEDQRAISRRVKKRLQRLFGGPE